MSRDRTPTRTPVRVWLRSLLLRTAGLTAGWLAVTEADPAGWSYAPVAVGLAVASSYLITGAPAARTPHWRGLLAAPALIGWVLARSVVGGFDVAARTLGLSGYPTDPCWRQVEIRLNTTGARVLLTFVSNLLPGSLAARLEGPRLDLHAISTETDVAATVAELERRIAAVLEPSLR